ncbi:MAG: hypothetical protein LC624_10250 [Halobacteriales archaeon]|nr:hypothetical protein [Halobacteriales archaeon]
MSARRRADALLLLALILAGPAGAVGLSAKVTLVGAHAGVLRQGESDAFPNLVEGPCNLQADGLDQLYLEVVESAAGDRIVLWTYEPYVRVAHVATGTPPHVYARTSAARVGCPDFEVEGQKVQDAAAYVVVSCDAVGICPGRLPT